MLYSLVFLASATSPLAVASQNSVAKSTSPTPVAMTSHSEGQQQENWSRNITQFITTWFPELVCACGGLFLLCCACSVGCHLCQKMNSDRLELMKRETAMGAKGGIDLKVIESDGPPSLQRVQSTIEDPGSTVRARIREEILSSERTYVSALTLLKNVYVAAIQRANEKGPNIYGATAKEFQTLQMNVVTLHDLHTGMLGKMEGTPPALLPGVLDEYSVFMRSYILYLNQYQEALKVKA